MGVIRRLPKKFKESVTYYRYVGGGRVDLGVASTHFMYQGASTGVGSFSELENFPMLYGMLESVPVGLREKDYLTRTDGTEYVIERIYTSYGLTRLELSEVV